MSRSSFLGLAFKLVQEAEKSWRRIRGHERIAELMGGVLFKDGEPVKEQEQEQQRLAEIEARLADAQSAFDRNQVGDRFLALAQAGVDPRFQTSRDLGRFLLEGMARGAMTYDEPARKERLLAVVKRAVRVLNRKGDVQELWPD